MRVCQYLHLSAIVTNFHVRRSVFPLALVLAFVANSLGQSGPFRHGDVLPAWVPGTLDIHQIVTGRGNAAFMMFPDGTTLLLDAGDAGDTERATQNMTAYTAAMRTRGRTRLGRPRSGSRDTSGTWPVRSAPGLCRYHALSR
jgi:hypothetical protein